MRLTKRRRSARPEMDMTPMIDIVFLLIIFFMTVTQISEANKEQLELPQQSGSSEQKPSVITINVTADGQIIVSGKTLALASMISLVGEELAQRGGDVQRLSIVVRSDQRGESRVTNEVVRSLGQLGIQRIRIAVQSSP